MMDGSVDLSGHKPPAHITYHRDLIQGSDEWLQARCGLLTASEMKLIITPTLKVASNEKERAHLYELLAQRITKHVEPQYIGDHMLRGQAEEAEARYLYETHYEPVETVGFITNDRWGFTLGYSPDGLVGERGLIECKSRLQKLQIETIVESIATGSVPADFLIQVQSGMKIAERDWLDFISFSDGMPMATLRIWPDDKVQGAIIEAAAAFEERLAAKLIRFAEVLADPGNRFIPTERKVYADIMV